MTGWFYFWMACFGVAGSAFALIAIVVAVRGAADLRRMFAGLRRERRR